MKAIITEKILEALYDAWERNNSHNLKQLCEVNNWDRNIFEDVVDNLERRYLIEPYAQWNYKITASGIDFAEKQMVVPKERSSKHQKARHKILKGLAAFREEKGKRERIHFKELCKNSDIDEELFQINDRYLSDSGYIKMVTFGCYQITDEGMQYL
jgi:predicted transcriptional regulator